MMEINTEEFQGPLGLLLQLVEKEELDITQISLAKIADQYVDYIRHTDRIRMHDMADFLVVAAKLLLIKSKALLPYLYPEEEEEIAELEQQLKMYKEFIEAAKQLEKMIGKKKFMFAREFNRQAVLANINLFAPPKHLQMADLGLCFTELLTRLHPVEKLEEETLERKVTIDEKIIFIQKLLLNRIKASFNQILTDAKSKTEIIVSFLAMLELIKQQEVVVEQIGLFTEIVISRNGG